MARLLHGENNCKHKQTLSLWLYDSQTKPCGTAIPSMHRSTSLSQSWSTRGSIILNPAQPIVLSH